MPMYFCEDDYVREGKKTLIAGGLSFEALTENGHLPIQSTEPDIIITDIKLFMNGLN